MKPGKNNTLTPLFETSPTLVADVAKNLWRSMPTFCLQVAPDYEFLTHTHRPVTRTRHARSSSVDAGVTAGGNCSPEQMEVIVRVIESMLSVGEAHVANCTLQKDADGKLLFFRGEQHSGTCPIRGASHSNTTMYFSIGPLNVSFWDFVCGVDKPKTAPHKLGGEDLTTLFGTGPPGITTRLG